VLACRLARDESGVSVLYPFSPASGYCGPVNMRFGREGFFEDSVGAGMRSSQCICHFESVKTEATTQVDERETSKPHNAESANQTRMALDLASLPTTRRVALGAPLMKVDAVRNVY
jgi:hypothetical protein